MLDYGEEGRVTIKKRNKKKNSSMSSISLDLKGVVIYRCFLVGTNNLEIYNSTVEIDPFLKIFGSGSRE